MYAIIEDSGQQFRVSEGDVLDVDLRELADGASQVEFDRVLLVGGTDDVKVGTPLVSGAKVVAEIVDSYFKGPKVHVYYWRRRKASRHKTGHRQKYLRVKVAQIVA
ncbi:MAG: 50S ribosomal protein L21 [Planctomycetes bacterium]|nr:50S ribosomal protein L21 [Planctomycetota bacterium]